MSEPSTFHPEAQTFDGGDAGAELFLKDTEPVDWVTVGRMGLSPDEWDRLNASSAGDLFSGQVTQVSWDDADRQVREVLGRGFEWTP